MCVCDKLSEEVSALRESSSIAAICIDNGSCGNEFPSPNHPDYCLPSTSSCQNLQSRAPLKRPNDSLSRNEAKRRCLLDDVEGRQ